MSSPEEDAQRDSVARRLIGQCVTGTLLEDAQGRIYPGRPVRRRSGLPEDLKEHQKEKVRHLTLLLCNCRSNNYGRLVNLKFSGGEKHQ